LHHFPFWHLAHLPGGLNANDREQWLSDNTGYHFASALGSVERNEFATCLLAVILKSDVENVIDGERATEVAKM